MTCPECDRRHAQELKQLSDCEGRCKEMSVKNQRLSIALAVVATLAGKESLDYALGLSSTLEGLSSATPESPRAEPSSIVSAPPDNSLRTPTGSTRSSYISGGENVLFSNLPPILPSLYEPEILTGYDSSPIFFSDPDQIFVPTSGMLLLAGLSTFPRRRRK